MYQSSINFKDDIEMLTPLPSFVKKFKLRCRFVFADLGDAAAWRLLLTVIRSSPKGMVPAAWERMEKDWRNTNE
jgi:hypothetical protein